MAACLPCFNVTIPGDTLLGEVLARVGLIVQAAVWDVASALPYPLNGSPPSWPVAVPWLDDAGRDQQDPDADATGLLSLLKST